MEIERPETGDVDELADLWVALAAEQRDHRTHILPERNRTQIRDTLHRHAQSGGAFVARVDGDIAGFVTFEFANDAFDTDVERGIVQNLYVRPERRNDGIGRALLDRAESELTENGADVVAVETMAANDDARRFYRRLGYEPHRITLETRPEDENHSKDRG